MRFADVVALAGALVFGMAFGFAVPPHAPVIPLSRLNLTEQYVACVEGSHAAYDRYLPDLSRRQRVFAILGMQKDCSNEHLLWGPLGIATPTPGVGRPRV